MCCVVSPRACPCVCVCLHTCLHVCTSVLQAVADLQKRREGAPKAGRVSIVVTDIENYSGGCGWMCNVRQGRCVVDGSWGLAGAWPESSASLVAFSPSLVTAASSSHTPCCIQIFLFMPFVPSRQNGIPLPAALMVKMPLAMGQAVSQHSNIIRRAAWTHYGNVVGQEGDSFLVGFRDALDAVAFCLQVCGAPRMRSVCCISVFL